MKKDLMKKNLEYKCVVCGKTVLTDINHQGECFNCGWYNSNLGEANENTVIYPNLLSLNKAKELYKEGKPLTPSLSDFLDGFEFYGEMVFTYNEFDCCLFRWSEYEDGIEFGWSPKNVYYFKDKQDFINNAKIGNEYVRDIWDKVEDPHYM